MCGIIGYVGERNAVEVLQTGLSQMEYRGYDSAGITISDRGCLIRVRSVGEIKYLESAIAQSHLPISKVGIGHTRWATHGAPTEENAHPHFDCRSRIAIVHNGIIENYSEIKQRLTAKGHVFRSETDSEVIAHLIEDFALHHAFEKSVRHACKLMEGSFGLVVLSADFPDTLFVARRGSPILIGSGIDGVVVASDASAIISTTRSMIRLKDDEMAVIAPNDVRVMSIDGHQVQVTEEIIDWDIAAVQKEGFEHFMLKEIFEQPDRLHDACRGRLKWDEGTAFLGGLEYGDHGINDLLRGDEIRLLGCGTSLHAAMIGANMIEAVARIRSRAENASEFRYRSPVCQGIVGMALSQSGETHDTREAQKELRSHGQKCFGIINAVGSLIPNENDGGVYIHAGPEIGVASTKAFTNMVMALGLLTLSLARRRDLGLMRGKQIVRAILDIPSKARQTLDSVNAQVSDIADHIAGRNNGLFLGRGYQYPIALEGALKMKEISYIHAEGYPAAEMKHGPIALIDENMPVIIIVTREDKVLHSKIMNNVREVKTRGGDITVIATEGDAEILDLVPRERVVYIPSAGEPMLSPILSVLPLQLLAYYCAVKRGLNVDKPRNLAKAVTVE